MDACGLWLPGKINLDQSHQEGQLRGVAVTISRKRARALPRDRQNTNGSSKPNTDTRPLDEHEASSLARSLRERAETSCRQEGEGCLRKNN